MIILPWWNAVVDIFVHWGLTAKIDWRQKRVNISIKQAQSIATFSSTKHMFMHDRHPTQQRICHKQRITGCICAWCQLRLFRPNVVHNHCCIGAYMRQDVHHAYHITAQQYSDGLTSAHQLRHIQTQPKQNIYITIPKKNTPQHVGHLTNSVDQLCLWTCSILSSSFMSQHTSSYHHLRIKQTWDTVSIFLLWDQADCGKECSSKNCPRCPHLQDCGTNVDSQRAATAFFEIETHRPTGG